MALTDLIIEDGTCVPDANSWNSIEDARDYWSMRFGGEPWDLSFSGKNYCESDIKKAFIGAVDYLNCLDWHGKCCTDNCLPSPIQCDCDAKPTYKIMAEAQLLIADAILRGWRPSVKSGEQMLVKSWSSPEEGSVSFARPVPLKQLAGCNATPDVVGAQLMARLSTLLKPLLARPSNRRRRVVC